MIKEMVKRKTVSSNGQNVRLSALREKINKTLKADDKHFDRNDLIDQVQEIDLNYKHLKEIDTENILFYLNYNKKFGLSQFKQCEYEKRLVILNRLLTLDMSKEENINMFGDFLIWGVNYLYKDQDMAKLVQYFCDNTNYKNSNLIFDIYSVYIHLVDGMKCKEIILKKHNEIKKEEENKLKSRIIL